MLITKGVEIVKTSVLMFHENPEIEITLVFYAHHLPNSNSEVADTL